MIRKIGLVLLFLLILSGLLIYRHFYLNHQAYEKAKELPLVTSDYCEYKNQRILQGETYSYDNFFNICLCTSSEFFCTSRVIETDQTLEYRGWKDYIDINRIAFKYPDGWKVTMEIFDISPSKTNSSGKAFKYKITSPQEDYLLYLPNPENYIPVCSTYKANDYMDDNVFRETGQNGKTTSRLFKRTYNGKGEYGICGEYFNDEVKYISNNSTSLDKETLHQMDLILLSIETAETPGIMYTL